MWFKLADFLILEQKNTKRILRESVIIIMHRLFIKKSMLIMILIGVTLRFCTEIKNREKREFMECL